MSTWRELISEDMEDHKDSWPSVVRCTLSDAELDEGFDSGYGGTRGKPFTLWTHSRVYFPACYDGSEWCASVPRDPISNEATGHVGGG